MKKDNTNKRNYIGIVMTVVISLFFVWAMREWYLRDKPPEDRVTRAMLEKNEIEAFKNLKKISEAQENYIKKDRDESGDLSYAKFVLQLNRTVTREGDYKNLNFIDKKLGFAMDRHKALKGYYFKDIRKRAVRGGQSIDIDYSKEWIVAAAPIANQVELRYVFLTDQTGKIYAKKGDLFPNEYPLIPEREGWILVNSLDDVLALQTSYEK